MLLTLSLTRPPATDLGYLLAKHPERVQEFTLGFGAARVFYPEAAEDRCTAALLLDVDPVALVRGRGPGGRGSGSEGAPLAQYVNDRPYVASSFLSVALAEVYRSALAGRCREKPELPQEVLPLEARVPVLPCPRSAVGGASGPDRVREIFEPLGYVVEATPLSLDERFPDWGWAPYCSLTLRAECRLPELLSHLYVLIPVLDRDKHYWIGPDEVEKLLRHGEGWLREHPLRDWIARRYLHRRPSLVRAALERLAPEEAGEAEESVSREDAEEASVEQPLRLNEARLQAVQAALAEVGARRILDLGCGEGRLIRELLKRPEIEQLTGMDVSYRALELARARLRPERLPPRLAEKVTFLHGSLAYRDARLAGYDAATLVEVIEHLDAPRLAALERVLFEFARPRTVLLTTPNREYDVRWPTLPAGRFRHGDHRFEWTRAEFRTWAEGIAGRFGYAAEFRPVGPDDPEVGSPTQMVLYRRSGD